MNGKQLHYIEVIARCGNIREAGVLLKRDPSTLTRMIRKVERELDVRLFRKTASVMIPTAEGEVLLDYAGQIGRLREKSGLNVDMAVLTEQEIQYLLMIQDCKSISGAASGLYISQPSLSQALISIENKLGEKIFWRTGEGLKETEFGRRFLVCVREAQELYRKLAAELEEFREIRRGVVRFGIPRNLGAQLLPQILPPFVEQYPGIQIQFWEHNSAELEMLLLADKIDFSIMHFEQQNTFLQYDKLLKDPFCLIVPETMKKQLQLPDARPLTVADMQQLGAAPFIMIDREQKLRQVADYVLEKANISPPVHFTTKNMETAKRLVAAGMGVAFIPLSYLDLFSDMKGIVSYALDEQLEAYWELVVAYRADRQLAHSARAFLNTLKGTSFSDRLQMFG